MRTTTAPCSESIGIHDTVDRDEGGVQAILDLLEISSFFRFGSYW